MSGNDETYADPLSPSSLCSCPSVPRTANRSPTILSHSSVISSPIMLTHLSIEQLLICILGLHTATCNLTPRRHRHNLSLDIRPPPPSSSPTASYLPIPIRPSERQRPTVLRCHTTNQQESRTGDCALDGHTDMFAICVLVDWGLKDSQGRIGCHL